MNGVPRYLSLCPNVVRAFDWLPETFEKDLDHPLVIIAKISDIIWESDPTYRNPDLADLDTDLAELEGTLGLGAVTTKMRDAPNYFDHRASLWYAAKYKRLSYHIEFIPESSRKKTPDLYLKNEKVGIKALLEIKHAGLKTAVELIIRKIQATPSRYSVQLTVETELKYRNQAENVAHLIESKLRAISGSDSSGKSHRLEIPGVGHCEFIPHGEGSMRMTGLQITWPRVVSIPKIVDRLSQLIENAREQLTDYSSGEVNIIALYTDDDSIKTDLAKAVLFEDPGLFTSKEYANITAVKYVRQMVGHQESLFINERNARASEVSLLDL